MIYYFDDAMVENILSLLISDTSISSKFALHMKYAPCSNSSSLFCS